MQQENITIIGGGASGLLAAIYAARKGCKVTILEKNNSCGKKILVTGNGRCNYFNEDRNIIHYRTQNKDLLCDIITDTNLDEILDLFSSLGIEPKIKNGYYYPYSNQAVSIQNALLIEARNLKIDIKTDATVFEIKKNENNSFLIITNQGNFYTNKIILSTGTKASQKDNLSDIGYKTCEKFGIKIIKPLPALVQLKGSEKYFKEWNGIRCDVKLTLFENNKYLAEETGEIQLTDYGISGICVMNLSGRVARGLDNKNKETIKINFLDGLNIHSINDAINFIDNRHNNMKNRSICELLEGIINYKLLNILLKNNGISINKKWNEIPESDKIKFAESLIALSINITGTNSFDKSQICSGGISLTEINTETMETKKVPGLYIIGELLDLDADCGGYNLTWAWLTGMIAGKNI